MKRHDVSNPGPDTRYPPEGKIVILWLEIGTWMAAWHTKTMGWRFANSYPVIESVVAWSDPTEPTVDHTAVMRQAAEALSLAVTQNSHDMMMTGDELRTCEAALSALRGAIGGV